MRISSLLLPIISYAFIISFQACASSGKPPESDRSGREPLPTPTASRPAPESPDAMKAGGPQRRTDEVIYRAVVESPEAAALYERILKLRKESKFNEAQILEKDYISRFPQGARVDEILNKFASEALVQGDGASAEMYYSRVVNLMPPSRMRGEATLGLAQARFAQGRRKEALNALHPLDLREIPAFRKAELYKLWAESADLEGRNFEAGLAALKLREEKIDQESIQKVDQNVEKKIKQLLTEAELRSLLKEYPRKFPAAQVTLRLAQIRLAAGDRAEAEAFLESLKTLGDAKVLSEASRVATRVEAISAAAPRRIGLLLPQNGNQAGVSRAFLDGLRLATETQGKELEIVVQDAGPTSETALSGFERLVLEEKVAMVIGPFSAGQVDAVARRSVEFGVPFVALSPRDGFLEKGTNIFRVALTFEKQVRALVGFAKEKLQARRFAILFPEDNFGAEFSEIFFRVVDELGCEVTAAESFIPSESDFKTHIENMIGTAFPAFRSQETKELTKALQEKLRRVPTRKDLREISLPPIVDFDALFIPDSFKALGQIAPALTYADVNDIILLGPATWKTPKLLERAAPYLEKSYVVDAFALERSSNSTRNFVDQFQLRYGKLPGLMSAQGYDIGNFLSQVWTKEQPDSREQWRKAFLNWGRFEGAMGRYDWDERRDPLAEIQLYSVRRGSFQYQGGITLKAP